MKVKRSAILILLLLALAGCNRALDSEEFVAQVAQEINATQTALAKDMPGATQTVQADEAAAVSPVTLTPIQADNANLLETLKTFTGEPITQLATCPGAGVIAYASRTGIHLLEADTLKETGINQSSSRVRSLTVSADGRFLAASVDPGKIHIWSLPEFSLLSTIEVAWVNKLAFSQDGRLLIGMTWDGVNGWQVPDGKLRFSTEGQEDWQGSTIDGGETFGLAPDSGKIIFPYLSHYGNAQAGTDGTEISWYAVDPQSGALESAGHIDRDGMGEDAYISEMAFSPDGKTFVVGWDGYPVEIWSLKQGKTNLEYTFPDQTAQARQLMFSADGQTLAIISWDSSIQLWDVQKRELQREWTGSHFAFLDEGRLAILVTGAEIQRIDLSSGEKLAAVPFAVIKSVSVSPDGALIAIGWNTGKVEIWNGRGQSLEHTLDSGMSDLASADFYPACECLSARSIAGETIFWRSPNWEKIDLPEGVSDPQFVPDANLIITKSSDPNQLLVWGESFEAPKFVFTHPVPVLGFQTSPTEPLAAVHIADGTIWFWDLNDGSFIRSLDDYLELADFPIFSNDGQVIATISDQRMLKIWSVKDASLLNTQEFPIPIEYAAMTPDNRGVIVEDWDGEMTYLWRFNNPASEEFPGTFAGFSPSGEAFVTEYYDGIKIWRLEDGRVLRTLNISGHFLGFSQDGSLAFVQGYPTPGDFQQYFVIMALESGETLVSIAIDGYIGWLPTSEDGSTLAGLTNTGTVYVWGIP